MPSRNFPPPNPSTPSLFIKTRVLFLALTISASVVIFCSILYFLYHLWHSLVVHRAKTIPFDSTAPLKLQRFSYKELKLATNGFDPTNVIGKGGSGTVFKGTLKDGKLIAIKRLDSLSLQTEREFQNELQILGGLRSPFLVTLLGYCVEKNKRVLVYDYMPNRSLQESLFGGEEEDDGGLSLSWERRFHIILDVSRALEFLHLGCDPPVIHGDVKPSNVLLDSEFRGKISDFGLSRIKVDNEFGVDLSQELWKSQELSGNLTAETPPAIALNLNSLSYNANIAASENTNVKGKEISSLDIGGGEDYWHSKFVPYDDEFSSSIDHKEHLAELSKKSNKLKNLQTKWKKKGFKVVPHFDLGRRFYLCTRRRNNFAEQTPDESDQNGGEFSFRRGWKKKSTRSIGSDMWSGDLFSRELSSTTSMRGTLCYVAPEYGGCGYLMEKADIYSLGVLILVIVSGRRPLHVLASPMKLEKANLISWCRHLAHAGNILELVDERLRDYNKEQASLCINLALICLQKIPELRPDIGDIVRILKGEMDLPPLPFEFSPSPPSKFYSRTRTKHKSTTPNTTE
ncbi:putative receptor-like protein kinase [Senna tora]|uniref:non-specific serine/threonine protein kinase n=1 Tax=Senna tora TaxID=362788 RepID=A0A834T5H1_9FABA|nr:putative receptor-like protein kinase [Senna tora]